MLVIKPPVPTMEHISYFLLKGAVSMVADRNKTESQNSKQNHKTVKQNRKTQNKITKLKTESQKPKQNHKTQNRITKP